MKPGLLIFSICLNILLASLAFPALRKSPVSSPTASLRSSAAPSSSPEARLTNSAATITFVTNRFHWRMVESDDYEKYMANLRGIRCPERTVRDIILADVQKHYALKSGALPVACGFWSCGPKRTAAERLRATHLQELQAQKRALILRLLGPDAVGQAEEKDDLIERAIMLFIAGPLPEGLPEQLMAVFSEGENETGTIRAQAGNFLRPEDEAAISKIHEKSLAKLHQLLSAGQLEEFVARAAAVQVMKDEFERIRLTPVELRQTALLHYAVFGLLDDGPFRLPSAQEQTEAKEEEFARRLQEFLGAERYNEYLREKDPNFQELCSLAEQQKLPRQRAIDIYQIKQLADEERQGLERDTSISAFGKEAELRQIQETARDSVKDLLGDQAFEAYLHGDNGGWLTNALTR